MASYMKSAVTANRISKNLLTSKVLKPVSFIPVRYRWKPPDPDEEILPPYSQRLAAWKSVHDIPPASTGNNIGLPFVSSTNKATTLKKLKQWSENKKDKALEKSARHQELEIDMHEVAKQWISESAPIHIKTVAEHYGIFRDLFDGAHFNSVVPLNIAFEYDDDFVTPVKYGNIIPAKEAATSPLVDFESNEDSLWTLTMSSPDGNLEENNKEILHWMISNIPGSDISQGDNLCDYLPPFPVKGAGFLRYVFILYKQNGKVDLKTKISESNSLQERSFSTLDFYRTNEEMLTPASVAFFQSEWDSSVRNVFHNTLNMPEPKFEFIHPPKYLPEQMEVPHAHSFYHYLDLYRDVKDLNEEVLKHKLKDLDPLSPPKKAPKFINIDKLSPDTPSWYRSKVQEQRLGKMHWKALYEEPKE